MRRVPIGLLKLFPLVNNPSGGGFIIGLIQEIKDAGWDIFGVLFRKVENDAENNEHSSNTSVCHWFGVLVYYMYS